MKWSMQFGHFGFVAMIVLASAQAQAQAPGQVPGQATAEQAIEYRKSAYHVVLWNWMPMSAMVRAKIPYDKTKFALHATRLAAFVPQLLEGFPKGSGEGKTEAKPEIWTNWVDFSAKMSAFEKESAALAKIAQTDGQTKGLAAVKAQFGKVGETCKGCHDKYKSE
jgi:cytochrome c556